MEVSAFTGNMPGELIRTLDGHMAFRPAPLPPALFWADELISTLSEADRALGRLAGIGAGSLGGINPHLLIRLFLRREAVLSSRIEGAQATLSQLFLFEEAQIGEKQTPDVREVANYVRALETGLEALKHRPLTVGLIKELHQILREGVRGADRVPGAFRRLQVFIGPTQRIADARFVPPPPLEVEPLMTTLGQYLQSPTTLPPLVRLALIHYQFEAIHPFQDGNGRLGRLLITLLLGSERLLPLPMLYLSSYFERYRQDYYQHLLKVSQCGAWTDWAAFFLRGVISEANDAVERVTRLMTLRSEYQKRFQMARASSLIQRLIDELFSIPAITARRVAKVLELTPAAAQAHIDRLIEAGILEETTGLKRNRIYLATGILQVLNDDPPHG